jgi:YD repeat-containing protein
VDAEKTDTDYTYNGLRLLTQRTVTDVAGTQLTQEKHGYNVYKNRTQTLDGRLNATYFFYDAIDRLTARKDALSNSTYFYYL